MEPNISTTLLQLQYPHLHQVLIWKFQQVGLQSYDFKAEVLESVAGTRKNPQEITLRVQFGETFTKHEDLTLLKDLVSPDNEAILKFFEHSAQSAHETLKDEYKESMNVGSRKKN